MNQISEKLVSLNYYFRKLIIITKNEFSIKFLNRILEKTKPSSQKTYTIIRYKNGFFQPDSRKKLVFLRKINNNNKN